MTSPHNSRALEEERPPQFGLRAMLIAMTVVSCGCALLVALFNRFGAMGVSMVALFGSLVGLHVLGNLLGTRLRTARRQSDIGAEEPVLPPPLPETPMMPAQRLCENTTIRRPWLIAAAVGALVFGSLGGVAIAAAEGRHLTVSGLALGIGSSAVLGGFFGFMASSLYSVARTALREALELHPGDGRK